MTTLIIGIIMMFISVILFYWLAFKEEKLKKFFAIMFSWYFCAMGSFWCVKYIYTNTLTSDKYILETEIRQKIINGKEVARDTVYIFTPKKK